MTRAPRTRTPTAWTGEDDRLLEDLLRIDTASPLETGRPGDLPAAQERYAAAAGDAGLGVVHFGPAGEGVLTDPVTPEAVRAAAAAQGPRFLAAQPNLVLAAGSGDHDRTLSFNFHMDTVAGQVPVRREGDLVYGRGAVDDKGPGVALLAGIRAALLAEPGLTGRVRLVVHSVAGEEGGAMGVYGTRATADPADLGRLTVVAEPTGMAHLDRSTAAMTLRVDVAGRGSVDDEAERGENATVLLGFLAAWFGEHVVPAVHDAGGVACVAGLHTGTAHNRVYGSGSLLVNIAYPDLAVAARLESLVEAETARALAEAARVYGAHPATAVTAAAATRVVHPTWVKRGLPTLDNRDPVAERWLTAAGFPRHREDDPAALRPFTCDAIWLGRPGGHTVVCGPGDLGANGAHAPDEHVSRTDLAVYADRIRALVLRFAEEVGR